MIHQSMSGRAAQARIDTAAGEYARLISAGTWTLAHAHEMLRDGGLNLFQIAGLAKAIACFQCSAD